MHIPQGLRMHFSQLRILKDLRTWTSARALCLQRAMSPEQKEYYRSPVPAPLRVLHVFFWRGCQDQSISVGLILDLPPGTSVVPLVSRDQTTLVGWNHNNLVILKCAATAAGLPPNQRLQPPTAAASHRSRSRLSSEARGLCGSASTRVSCTILLPRRHSDAEK